MATRPTAQQDVLTALLAFDSYSRGDGLNMTTFSQAPNATEPNFASNGRSGAIFSLPKERVLNIPCTNITTAQRASA